MKKSRLLAVFKTLSKEELKVLKKFVDSPFHNQQKDVVTLCAYLTKLSPKFEDKKIQKSIVFRQIFPKTPFKDVKMRYVMAQLLKVVKEFIAYQQYKKNEIIAELNLLAAFRERNLPTDFERTLSDIRALQTKSPSCGQAHFYHQYLIESEYHLYLEAQQQRRIEPNLEALSPSLDYFYLVTRLRCYCTMLNYQNLINIDYDFHLKPRILDYLSKYWNILSPVVAIYYHVLLMLLDGNNGNHFQRLEQLLQVHYEEFPLNELKNIHGHIRNYCIRQFNKGNRTYLNVLFSAYKMGLEQRTLWENGSLSPSSWKNIVSMGIQLKDYDWVARFIAQYKNELSPVFRANIPIMGEARLHFERKNFGEVLSLLQEIKYDDLFTTLDAKALLLCTYYELKADKSLDALISNFKEYIRRHKEIGYHKDNYLNLIKLVRKLVNVNIYDKKKVQDLAEEIAQIKRVGYKEWLLEKIEELR